MSIDTVALKLGFTAACGIASVGLAYGTTKKQNRYIFSKDGVCRLVYNVPPASVALESFYNFSLLMSGTYWLSVFLGREHMNLADAAISFGALSLLRLGLTIIQGLSFSSSSSIWVNPKNV